MIRVYSYKNGGLPSDDFLNNGSLLSALKAALITGTSKKTAAGWRLVYESIANQQDAKARIVVQSQSANSEQMYYEIVDGGIVEITMYERWDMSTLTGSGKSSKVYIKKIAWDGDNVIIANDRFVWLSITHISACFGDYDSYTPNEPKSILLGSLTPADYRAVPAHSNNIEVYDRAIVDIDNRQFCLRHYRQGFRGWSLSIGFDEKMQDYVYPNSDSAMLVKSVELGIGEYDNFKTKGLIPFLVYCDKLIGTGAVVENGKYIHQQNYSTHGIFLFEVDEL